ncbi:MAG TPA: helix-turn-helix domain-containing protein [Verrucomicrobiae bacterium]|nr:helix-turn-helix domain-containing protein [Verrucomicrobiae bacterium]
MDKAGKREQNKQTNRNAILTAARQVFSEHGYDAVTIRDVVRQTELATGTFYNYFSTKEELLRALIESHMRDLTAELTRVRGAARSLDTFVHGAYLAAFTAIAQDPVLYNLMLRNEAAVRSLYQESIMGLSTQALRDDIRDATRRGIMPALDADYLAAAFFGAGYEMGRILAESPKKDPVAAAAFATRLFLGGVHAFASDRVATLKPRVRARDS